MTSAGLAAHLARESDENVRGKHIWELLEKYRWEPPDRQPSLLAAGPAPTGEHNWDTPRAMLEDLSGTA
jgi:hypothetical protein